MKICGRAALISNYLVTTLTALVAIGLTNCGGGSTGGSTLPPPPPVTATETVLYSFQGNNNGTSDGYTPTNKLLPDGAGNLYGITIEGGAGALPPNASGTPGTVFKLDTSAHESVLYNLQGPSSGAYPTSALVADNAGTLYGTTMAGGPDTLCGSFCGCSDGCGTVFKLDSSGNQITLHYFTGQNGDGAYPNSIISDGAGNFYGVTVAGGSAACWCGTIFKVDSAGNESILYSFTNQNGDGSGGLALPGVPAANLILESTGNLYGATLAGGGSSNCSTGCGTVFKLASNGQETVLYGFSGSDGKYPNSLLLDKSGNLYGTTWEGGGSNNCGQRGCGTVFKIDTSGHQTVLYNFTSSPDGALPTDLLADNSGNLYGVTMTGGTSANCSASPFTGCGTFFKLDSTGHETALYSFKGVPSMDGYNPAGLVTDAAGNFYGTTQYGGVSCAGITAGCGTVFKITLH